MVGEVQFATTAEGREIAYRVMSEGDGPLIVHTGAGPYPIDLLDEDVMYDRFLRTLGLAGRLVVYNRPSTGSSDPLDPDGGFFEQMTEAYLAVVDALGADKAWIVGQVAANITETIRAHPDRVSGAVIINPFSPSEFGRNVDLAIARERDGRVVATKESLPSRADDPAFLDWSSRAGRLGSSGAEAADLLSANRRAVERFVAEAEPVLGAPPIMLIRRRKAMSTALLEWWNQILPDAECVTIEGADSSLIALDAGLVAELTAGFITGTTIESPAQRHLVAVLFTDLVDSTPTAAASGDTVWRSTLDRYEATVHRTIRRHHGTVVKHTGDGALATFPSGSEAIDAAVELRNTTRDLGLDGRTGIHVGEIEQRGDDISGIAVNLAARIMAEAKPGEIVVSSSVEQATIGGPFRFDDRGHRPLKGIDRPWQLFGVDLQE